jgi:DNA-binding NtrC family response regulator
VDSAGRPDDAIGDLELVIFSGDDVRTFSLPPSGTVTIGRGEASALRIDDPSVSRNHAVLHTGAPLTIEDLGSANGTMIRGKTGPTSPRGETMNVRHLLKHRAELAVGDSLLFGTTNVVVRHRPTVPLPDLAAVGPGIIVGDATMRAVYEQATRAARANINVLILGETGVGKEVLAHAIHAHSRRSSGPFLGINCATLTESLQESELFGFEKGAFTGAHQARAGLFESAQGGTVFLDEVGELAASTQAKLLRVLEERTVTRLGSSRARPIDVRFVSATNRDLEAESATPGGRFRSDIFFRLNGISLLIPPLRERPGEIVPFAQRFLTAAAREVERPVPPVLAPAVLELLAAHRWPGNVRELRNVIERAVVLCLGDTILPEHLPPSLLKAVAARPLTPVAAAVSAPAARTPGPAPLQREIDALEKTRILDALERAAGNQTRAARMLGISRGTLLSRLDDFGIPRPRKRDE